MSEFDDLAYEQKESQKVESLPTSFMSGTEPGVLEGFYKGKLELIIPQKPLEYSARTISSFYMPWMGKEFFGDRQTGINIFALHTKFFLHRLFPKATGEKTLHGYRAFPFRTSIQRGLIDPINVLRLDYDLPENPEIVRRVLDELVEVDEGNYLGKAYIKTSQAPRLVAYFRLLALPL